MYPTILRRMREESVWRIARFADTEKASFSRCIGILSTIRDFEFRPIASEIVPPSSRRGEIQVSAYFLDDFFNNNIILKNHSVLKDLPDVRDIGRNVIFGARIEIVLRSQNRGLDTGVLLHQPVPMTVVVFPGYVTTEHVPPPPIHYDAERQHHQFIHGKSEQVIDIRRRLVDVLVTQT